MANTLRRPGPPGTALTFMNLVRFRPWQMRLVFYSAALAVTFGFLYLCVAMPGSSAQAAEGSDPALAAALRQDVTILVQRFARRNLRHPAVLTAAEQHLAARLLDATGSEPSRERVATQQGDAWNLFSEVAGRSGERARVIVGAHYDTAHHTPGANDNGSGVAALLALAERFAAKPTALAVRFALFANEEQPYFQSEEMGSLVHARACRRRGEEIRAMLSLETMAYYSDEADSQRYPFPFGLLYPDTGNFIAFVSNMTNRGLVRDSIAAFREHTIFPSEGGALPGYVAGVGWSDHWAFWEVGYPALMITDTAPFRDPHYHRATDDVDRLDFERLAIVVAGLEAVVRELAGE